MVLKFRLFLLQDLGPVGLRFAVNLDRLTGLHMYPFTAVL